MLRLHGTDWRAADRSGTVYPHSAFAGEIGAMGRENSINTGLRCRAGDWARVVHSIDSELIGKVVLVEEWRPEHGRWGVCLLSGPVCGHALVTGELIVTSRFGFRDSSLEPLPRATGESGTVNSVSLQQQEVSCHQSGSPEF